MFRKSTLLVGALALMLVSPQAHAAKGDVGISIGGGGSMPIPKNGASAGFMGAGDVDYGVTEAVSVGLDGQYHRANSSNAGSGGAHVKYMFPMSGESKVSPYVVAGPSMFRDNGTNMFGGRGGLGMNYKTNGKISINAEADFQVYRKSGFTNKLGGLRAGITCPLNSTK